MKRVVQIGLLWLLVGCDAGVGEPATGSTGEDDVGAVGQESPGADAVDAVAALDGGAEGDAGGDSGPDGGWAADGGWADADMDGAPNDAASNDAAANDAAANDPDGSGVVPAAASILVIPKVGQPTAAPGPYTNCACDAATPFCHAIYVATVEGIDDLAVQMRFAKFDGSGPSIDVAYQVRTLPSPKPTCQSKLEGPVVLGGVWPAGQPLQISFSPWPSHAEFDAAPCGDTHRVNIVTTGSDDPTVFRWWMGTPLTIRKVCGGDPGTLPDGSQGGSTPGDAADLADRSFQWGVGEPIAWNTLATAKQWDFDAQLDVI